jgi:hypothetical protein
MQLYTSAINCQDGRPGVIVHLLVKLGYNVGGNPFLREEERCGYSFVCPQ